jgi:hypothetical protein
MRKEASILDIKQRKGPWGFHPNDTDGLNKISNSGNSTGCKDTRFNSKGATF